MGLHGARRSRDNVYSGPGAKVSGTVEVGSNAVVVANSSAMARVSLDPTAVGVPARTCRRRAGSLRFDGPGTEEGGAVRAGSDATRES